jgi:hypothetical protein
MSKFLHGPPKFSRGPPVGDRCLRVVIRLLASFGGGVEEATAKREALCAHQQLFYTCIGKSPQRLGNRIKHFLRKGITLPGHFESTPAAIVLCQLQLRAVLGIAACNLFTIIYCIVYAREMCVS